eukprot:754380-Hanusia_phi.AAC.2
MSALSLTSMTSAVKRDSASPCPFCGSLVQPQDAKKHFKSLRCQMDAFDKLNKPVVSSHSCKRLSIESIVAPAPERRGGVRRASVL